MSSDDAKTIELQNDVSKWELEVKDAYSPYKYRMMTDAQRKLQKHLSSMEKKMKKQLEFQPVNKQGTLL